MVNPHGVIVLGGHVQALGIVRVFGRLGISVCVIDHVSRNLARHSRYCSNFILCDERTLVETLVELGRQGEYHRWLLIPTSDYHVEQLSRAKDMLEMYFAVGVDNWARVEVCYNKKLTYQLASRIGISIPKSYFPTALEEAVESARRIGYPCIIKPAIMHVFYKHFRKKVFLCQNEKEFCDYWCEARDIVGSEGLIVQEVIRGASHNQYSVCFLYDGTSPVVTLAARRARQHPIDFGNATTYAETVSEPELVATASRMLRELQFRGLCEVEFKYDDLSGSYQFLEINPRTWKWHSIAVIANTPFLPALYDLTYKGTATRVSAWPDVAWRHWVTDIPTVVSMMVRGQYVRPSTRPTIHAVYDPGDMMPSLFELIYLPYLTVSR